MQFLSSHKILMYSNGQFFPSFSYPFEVCNQFVELILFLIVVKELFALFRRFSSVQLSRYHSPISARVLEASFHDFYLVL